MIETRWVTPGEVSACARCGEQKKPQAYAYLRRVRATGGKVIAVERDVMCRRCRGENARGVPDKIVQLRLRELRLARELQQVRRDIRAAIRGDTPPLPLPEEISV